jgi:hypothetical protein
MKMTSSTNMTSAIGMTLGAAITGGASGLYDIASSFLEKRCSGYRPGPEPSVEDAADGLARLVFLTPLGGLCAYGRLLDLSIETSFGFKVHDLI